MNFFFIGLLCLLSVEMAFSQKIHGDTLNVKHNTASNNWSFAAEVYYYILPNEKNTTTMIGYADYRSFHSALVFQRGIFARYTFRKLAAGVHYFNPHSSDGFVLLSFDYEF